MNNTIPDIINLIVPETLYKNIPFSQLGYKRLYQCKCKLKVPGSDYKICNARFRTLELLQKHQLKHNTPCKHDVILVDSEYINNRLEECGKKLIIFGHKDDCDYHSDCTNRKVLVNKCFIRMCPKCEEQRRNRYIRTFNSFIKNRYSRINFLTITFKGHHALTNDKKHEFEVYVKRFMDRLKYRSETILGYGTTVIMKNGKKYKKSHIQYIRVLEVKHKGDGYYYHYHFIIDMPYIAQTVLSRMWADSTNNESCIVDIKHVGRYSNGKGWLWSRGNNDRSAIMYVSKYLAKPIENITTSEYASVLYQNKMVECQAITSLDNKSNDRGKNSFFVCECCGELLKYVETCSLEGEKHTKDIQITLNGGIG